MAKMSYNLQVKLAIASVIIAVAFSIAGFIIPPTGDLTDANLYLVAQFLLVTTSILGVSAVVTSNNKTQTQTSYDYETKSRATQL